MKCFPPQNPSHSWHVVPLIDYACHVLLILATLATQKNYQKACLDTTNKLLIHGASVPIIDLDVFGIQSEGIIDWLEQKPAASKHIWTVASDVDVARDLSFQKSNEKLW